MEEPFPTVPSPLRSPEHESENSRQAVTGDPPAALGATAVNPVIELAFREEGIPFPVKGLAIHDTERVSGSPSRDFPFLGPPEKPDEIGRLGPYRILKLLGKGGMGFVFHAEDTVLQRPVALKVMRPEVAAKPASKDRFLREGRAAARLKSDHIVTIHQVGEVHGVPYMALEFLEGVTLEDWLKNRTDPVSLPLLLKVARDVLKGLSAAHEKGLVHRDIKPANLWVESTTQRIKVLDFGLTREADGHDQVTHEGAVVGTPAYMAPEQADGKAIDGRTDLFAVGVVLHQLVSGASPFHRGEMMATMMAVANHEPPPLAAISNEIPTSVSNFVARLLSKDPAGRPANAKVALAELLVKEKTLPGESLSSSVSLSMILTTPTPVSTSIPNSLEKVDGSSTWESPTKRRKPPALPVPPEPMPLQFLAGEPSQHRQDVAAPVSLEAELAPSSKKRPLIVLVSVLAMIALSVVIIRDRTTDGSVTQSKKPDDVGSVDWERPTLDSPVVERPKTEPVKTIAVTGLATIDKSATAEERLQKEWSINRKLPVETPNTIGLKLMLIPPVPDGKEPYYMGKYEVTQEEWGKVMEYHPSHHGRQLEKLKGMDTTKFPVDKVNWFECIEFCNRLSQKEGFNPYYEMIVTERTGPAIERAEVKFLGGNGYHLPTDEEWIWACMAGVKTKYHFGNDSEHVPEYGWVFPYSGGLTHGVGEKKPNAFGLYDMYGNVREWTSEILPQPTTGALARKARGGNYHAQAGDCLMSIWSYALPTLRNPAIGLRVARVP